MNLARIQFLKSCREGGLINLFMIAAIVAAAAYKDAFMAYMLIPALFYEKFLSLIWSGPDEKLFYSQFQEIQLKKIVSLNQIQLLAAFNACHLLSVLPFAFGRNFMLTDQISHWLILNIFLFVNLTAGILLFDVFSLGPFIKTFMLTVLNALLCTAIFFMKACLADFSIIALLLVLLILAFYRSYALNALFNHLEIKKFYD
ncbi:MAG: hypothetical protein REI96_12225 [Flavobacterium nitrogenifigens]|uniref:hypothetical protein n=1 Tax=Flavobacterium nitrogenifigens TaxID=1617283 RepID=UPI002808732B|nr:hypothetical protein [Flavobacterium nitrogenifigens]MDQ8013210.1 hypothetical protein [Flavobacterium nitrogenifigens]